MLDTAREAQEAPETAQEVLETARNHPRGPKGARVVLDTTREAQEATKTALEVLDTARDCLRGPKGAREVLDTAERSSKRLLKNIKSAEKNTLEKSTEENTFKSDESIFREVWF